jgi:hypothetical protein
MAHFGWKVVMYMKKAVLSALIYKQKEFKVMTRA